MTPELNSLIEDHLDGELTDAGFDALSNALYEEGARREFAVKWMIHSLLHDLVSQRHFEANTLAEMTAANDTRVNGAGVVAPRSRFWIGIVSLAVVLLVSATAGMFVYHSFRPSAVAMLTQTANCRWDEAGKVPVDGALLKAGDTLHLLEGHALVTFTSGARMVLEGPTELVLESPSVATLSGGAVNGRVPSQAVGFEVKLPFGTVVDLGTEFAIRLRPDHSFNVQVFEGMVELRLLNREGHFDESPLRISRGVAVKVDAQLRQPESIAYDEGQRIVMP